MHATSADGLAFARHLPATQANRECRRWLTSSSFRPRRRRDVTKPSTWSVIDVRKYRSPHLLHSRQIRASLRRSARQLNQAQDGSALAQDWSPPTQPSHLHLPPPARTARPPAEMSPPPASGKKVGPRDLFNGGLLQCLEAATLGMPFEVWKTRMGRYRTETTLQAFRNVMREGGGVSAFWAGTGPKMVESASKGAILLFSKEAISDSLLSAGVGQGATGFLAGAGGGVCQVVVMGPCTFLVTGAVTGDRSISTMQRIHNVYGAHGLKGFYPGGTAIAFRQATNWASRQGFTEIVRGKFKVLFHGDKDAKLTVAQEAGAGIVGGGLACWNHPFEVARIQMQSAADRGEPKQNMVQVFRTVIKEQGYGGLFKGIVPRLGLGIWQTLFMVTGAKLVRQALEDMEAKK